MLTDYTSYASVRTVLGTTARELPDAFLEDDLFEYALLDELATLGEAVEAGSDLAEEYLDLVDDSGSITPAVTAFIRGVRLFASHFIAAKCLSAMPELSPAMITDSKAALKKDQTQAAARVQAAYQLYYRRLQETYAGYLEIDPPTTATMTYMAVSSPSYDPVTDE